MTYNYIMCISLDIYILPLEKSSSCYTLSAKNGSVDLHQSPYLVLSHQMLRCTNYLLNRRKKGCASDFFTLFVMMLDYYPNIVGEYKPIFYLV